LSPKYHIILINPSQKFFAIQASPRASVSYERMPKKQIFYDINDGFSHYSREDFSFIKGTATDVDFSKRQITVQEDESVGRIVDFHALVLAVGVKTHSPLFSVQTTVEDVEQAHEQFRSSLGPNKKIVVAGGGATSIELASEIAREFGGYVSWLWPRQTTADITLVTRSDRLLPNLPPAIGKQADVLLSQLGIKILYNKSVVSASAADGDGQNDQDKAHSSTRVELSNGETLGADIYVPSTGVAPNTKWLPQSILNESGFIRTNKESLRVEEAGPRVYAIGDSADYGNRGIPDIYLAAPVVATNLVNDLMGEEIGEKGQDAVYKPEAVTQMVPITDRSGVGIVSGRPVPSFLVWLVKSRDYLTRTTPHLVDGSKWAAGSGLKQKLAYVFS